MSNGEYGCAPNVEWAVDRSRIVQQLDLVRGGGLLLLAPHGYGKSVLAAQISTRFSSSLWIDAQGQAVAIPFLDELAASRSPVPACLVVDDATFAATEDRRRLVAIERKLARSGGLLVITSRHAQPNELADLRGFRVVEEDELRLSDAEAKLIAGRIALSGEMDVAELLMACQGHPGLFCELVGSGSVSHVSASLAGWLHYALEEVLSPEQRLAAIALAFMGEGTASQLRLFGIAAQDGELRELSRQLPLVRTSRSTAGIRFTAHEVLRRYLCESGRVHLEHLDCPQLESLIRGLDSPQRSSELALAARSFQIDPIFVLSFGPQLLIHRHWDVLRRLLEACPMAEVIGNARLLLLWSQLDYACCAEHDVLSRVRAAAVLAEHENDWDCLVEARTLEADALRVLGRLDDAGAILAELSARKFASVSEGATARIEHSQACVLMLAGQYEEAERHARRALELHAGRQDKPSWLRSLISLAILAVLRRGDFFTAVRSLSPHAEGTNSANALVIELWGNLSAALVEVGRLERVSAHIPRLVGTGHTLSIHFLPAYACMLAGLGREDESAQAMDEALGLALHSNDLATYAINSVYRSVMHRSAQQLDQSLHVAERAHEILSIEDCMCFRRLAALEVAASLLALGDISASQAWVASAAEDGFGENRHHEFRAAMILAECARRSGDLDAAVDTLSRHCDHLRTENSNWQAAMYCRAFPELLGLLSMAAGVDAIPEHMLRMLLPEHRERCLRAGRAFMPTEAWSELGIRLLGEPGLRLYLDRKGLPLCHVRFFGGLEVKIEDRAVRERDWKKRKARLLFAMLVARRGQDVPRDQILEHLWPELDEERAKNNFYVAWSTMKSALTSGGETGGKCPYIESSRGRCRIVRDWVRSDIDEFEEFVTAAKQAEAEDDLPGAVAACQQLAGLYRGDLLPGDVYDDWFSVLRDRYRFEFVDAMSRVVEMLLEADDPCEALIFARRGLDADPYREDLYQLALRCHIAAGQRSAAIETFLQCKSHLADELGLDPSSETYALYQNVLGMEDRPRPHEYGLAAD